MSSIHWNDYDWQVFISEASLNDVLYDKQCYNTTHVEDFCDSLPSLSSASPLVLCLGPFFGSGTAHTEKYINITYLWSVKVVFVFDSQCFGLLTLSGTNTSLPKTTDVRLVIICILHEESMVVYNFSNDSQYLFFLFIRIVHPKMKRSSFILQKWKKKMIKIPQELNLTVTF